MFYIYLLLKCCGFFCVSLLRTHKKTSQTALRRSYCNFYLVLRCVFFDSLYSRTTCLCVLYYLPIKCCVFLCFPLCTDKTPHDFGLHVQLACVFYYCCNGFETLILEFLFSVQVCVFFLRTYNLLVCLYLFTA